MKRRPSITAVVTALTAAMIFGAAPSAANADSVPAPLSPVRPTSPLIDMPASYPVQPQLRVFPDDPGDAKKWGGARPYDEIAPLLNDLMSKSDRVSTQVVSHSAQGRDIYLVTVTAPETAAETARQDAWRGDSPKWRQTPWPNRRMPSTTCSSPATGARGTDRPRRMRQASPPRCR